MPSLRLIRCTPDPVLGSHVPAGIVAIARFPRKPPAVCLPGATTGREQALTLRRVVVCALLGLACALLARSCTPQARASEPLPELSRTLSQLDRIHDALWLHEGERCAKHLGGRCL